MAILRQTQVAKRARGPRLGEMLIAKGIITDEQLEDALREQQVTAERLGTILVSRGYVNEVDLVRILDSRTPENVTAWSRAWVEQRGRPEFATANSDAGRFAIRVDEVSRPDRVHPE